MALKISPRSNLDNMTKGEETAFEIDVTDELGDDTVNTHTFKVYDSSGTDVTSNFSGNSIILVGVITFGVKAYDVGTYTLEFIITCNEFLPDGTTPKEFSMELTVTIT